MTKQTHNLIAALTLTAVVLVAILLATPNRSAQAGMVNAQPGFTLVTSGSAGGNEALEIIDNNSKKMIVYTLVNNNNLNVIAGYDLSK